MKFFKVLFLILCVTSNYDDLIDVTLDVDIYSGLNLTFWDDK
jgi:hypothetical protein